jgi:hypothetical protein
LQFRENRCEEQPLIATTTKTAVNARKRHIGGLRPRSECILPKKYSSRFAAGRNAFWKNSDISLPDDSLIRHYRYTRPRIAGICLLVDSAAAEPKSADALALTNKTDQNPVRSPQRKQGIFATTPLLNFIPARTNTLGEFCRFGFLNHFCLPKHLRAR